MRFLLRLSPVVLTFAAAQPLLAAQPTDGGVAAIAPATLADDGAGSAAVPPFRTTPSASSSSLAHVFALSVERLSAARQTMQSLTNLSTRQIPSRSILEQLPVVVSMRRRAGERWNTSDSSRPSDFALCYRFTKVMGLQVIPGDLTPSKLPTPKMLSVKNQGSGMGVLVGITLRVGRAGK